MFRKVDKFGLSISGYSSPKGFIITSNLSDISVATVQLTSKSVFDDRASYHSWGVY